MNPANPLFQLAQQHHQAGRLPQAEAIYRQILARQPDHADALQYLGLIAHQVGHHDSAIELIRRSLAIQPNNAGALCNLASVLQAARRPDEAIAACQSAIALDPHFPEAYYNLGSVLADLGRFEPAADALRKAITLRPGYAQAYRNLGMAMQELCRFDQAIAAYRQAIAINPQFAEAHRNLSIALRTIGNFTEGWEEYEWRWKCPDFSTPFRNFPKPLWDGRNLGGDTLLLHCEQGFGDTIQFIRYLPLVRERAGKIIIECPPELHRLLRPLASDCRLVVRGEALPAFEMHCPIMSLPHVFATTLETIPCDVPYLHADAEIARRWQERLAGEANLLKVGLVWAGNKNHRNDGNRSLAPPLLKPLTKVPGVRFISLQKGESRAAPDFPLIDWTAELHDFADTAGLIAGLDLIITVDTSAAHLAGAMGKPVWVMLPFVPDWRWLLNRAESPWYPTAKLFRQPAAADWSAVVNHVAAELAKFRR